MGGLELDTYQGRTVGVTNWCHCRGTRAELLRIRGRSTSLRHTVPPAQACLLLGSNIRADRPDRRLVRQTLSGC